MSPINSATLWLMCYMKMWHNYIKSSSLVCYHINNCDVFRDIKYRNLLNELIYSERWDINNFFANQ